MYGRGSSLGHVTNIMLTHFHSLVPRSLHMKFVVFEESKFQFS